MRLAIQQPPPKPQLPTDGGSANGHFLVGVTSHDTAAINRGDQLDIERLPNKYPGFRAWGIP
jgi:hypothetical protein